MIDKNWFTPVRYSHLTRHSGPGSIVRDRNDWLTRVLDTRHWPQDEMVQLHAVVRVKEHLKIDQKLLLPPTAVLDDAKNLKVIGASIPIQRFPNWMTCKGCRKLHYKPWDNQDTPINELMFCQSCGTSTLEQISWCAVSSHGDLADVPWHRICHRGSNKRCDIEQGVAYLKIETVGRNKKVQCTKCNAEAGFVSSDFKDIHHYQGNERINPSISDTNITYTIIEVNDPRIYNAQNAQALVIPPESNVDRGSLAYKLSINSQLINAIKTADRPLLRKKLIKRAARGLECSVTDLMAAIDVSDTPESPTVPNIMSGDMYEDEYAALIIEEVFPENADFKTLHYTTEWSAYIDSLERDSDPAMFGHLIGQLISVERLRVIEVFKGFSRMASDSEDFSPTPVLPPDIDNSTNWLPAIELFGEGIFFCLNQEIISNWESNHSLRLRAQELIRRYENSDMKLQDDIEITPRFIMLHTLAHLIIRELESAAGYPAASLQERIYSSTSGEMMGVLIYTAVPDVAGSMGGIVELAKPKQFLRILSAAMNHADWCSLDPVCSEMEGQGPAWLNRAACHACSLVPDTSCRYNNTLLDRIFLKGSIEEGIPSLMDSVRDYYGKENI